MLMLMVDVLDFDLSRTWMFHKRAQRTHTHKHVKSSEIILKRERKKNNEPTKYNAAALMLKQNRKKRQQESDRKRENEGPYIHALNWKFKWHNRFVRFCFIVFVLIGRRFFSLLKHLCFEQHHHRQQQQQHWACLKHKYFIAVHNKYGIGIRIRRAHNKILIGY